MSRKGLWLFIATGIGWGIPYIFIKIAVKDFTPEAIVFARTTIAALVLIPIAIKRNAILPALKKYWVVFVFACLEMAGPWWLINSAEHGHVSSGLAGLMISTTPFFAMALGYFYMGDRSAAHPKNMLGLVFGFIGIALLVGIDAFSSNLDVLWVLACIAAALGYAVAPAVATKNASDVPTVGILALAMATTSLLYAVPAVLNPFEPGVTSPRMESWVSLLILGVVCSALTFVLFFELMKEISYSRSSLITYLNTAVAILAGVIFAGEAFTLGMALGLPLVAVGSYLASRHHA